MEYVYPDASIECLGAELVAKKFQPTGMHDIPNIGVVKKYTLSRNGLARVEDCLTDSCHKHRKESHVIKDDIVKGERLFVYVRTKGILKTSKRGGYTSSHGTNTCKTKDFTFAQITVPFPTNIIDPRQAPVPIGPTEEQK